MKVLTNAELKKLQKIIFEIYADYISYLQKKYPKLTEEDILYLCLNEAKLQPLTIALCFGYNNTHPINQRKLRIKERMKDRRNVKCDQYFTISLVIKTLQNSNVTANIIHLY